MNKYSVGDCVRVFRGPEDTTIGLDFVGEILSATDTGEGWEYVIQNAPMIITGFPCLVWESEIIGKEQPCSMQ